jgi:hypothetical protein
MQITPPLPVLLPDGREAVRTGYCRDEYCRDARMFALAEWYTKLVSRARQASQIL